MSKAYYNEIDKYAARWLRNLIAAGHIADGDVDERSIEDVTPNDVMGYTQCHFFAGIGAWSYALRLGGWPDGRSVWTGSCPCQPFSSAGKGGGFADERHLWPSWHHLIRVCKPANIFGEQVASKDGLAWLDLVQADLEATGYRCGATDLCVAGVGGPHIRQRQWIVADSYSGRQHRRGFPQRRTKEFEQRSEAIRRIGRSEITQQCVVGVLADSRQEFGGSGVECRSVGEDSPQRREETTDYQRCCSISGVALGDPNDTGLEGWRLPAECARELFAGKASVAGFWGNADWIYCRDEKYRPVEPGTFPLAHRATSRVGRLRAYGNAISPQAAKEVITAYLAVEQEEINNPENGQR